MEIRICSSLTQPPQQKALDHPHIIRLFEYYEDYNNVYIIMETARGGELFDVIEENYRAGYRLNETWIAVVFQQSTFFEFLLCFVFLFVGANSIFSMLNWTC